MNNAKLVQYAIYFISTMGMLLGLDLLFGAKITANLKKLLEKTVLDIDTGIVRASSYFKKTLDVSVDIDQKIIKTKAKIALGLLFIAISAVMLFIASKEG